MVAYDSTKWCWPFVSHSELKDFPLLAYVVKQPFSGMDIFSFDGIKAMANRSDAADPQINAVPQADSLEPLVYAKLRQAARRFMARERSGHTMQATELVHDAYLRMCEQNSEAVCNECHFVALASTMMRRILINHALARRAEKRGSGALNLTLSAADSLASGGTTDMVDILSLDSALTKLAELDQRMAKVVELRYFGGLSIPDTAEALGISPATVKREWITAKLWLAKELRS